MKNRMSTNKIQPFLICLVLLVGIIAINNDVNSVYSLKENKNQISPILNSEEAEWSVTEAVAIGSASIGQAYVYTMDVDEQGNVHLFWSEHSANNINYKIWFAENQSWSADELAKSGGYTSYSCAIDSEGNVHFVWNDYGNDIGYKFRDTSSGIWSTPETVSTPSFRSYRLDIAVDSFDNIHFLWEDIDEIFFDTDYDHYLYYRSKSSNGTWSSVYEVDSYLGSISGSSRYDFDIAIDHEDNVQICYSVMTSVYLKSKNYSTQIWSGNTLVNTGGLGYDASLTIDAKGNIHCLWSDGQDDYQGSGSDVDVFHRYWNITSQTWSSISLVSSESADHSTEPSTAADTYGNVYIVWEDNSVLIDTGTDPDILYKNWSCENLTWSSSELVSSEGTGWSILPIIACDIVGNIHCVWIDDSTYDGGTGYLNSFYKNKIYPSTEPVLATIVPNPSSSGIIDLNWSDIVGILHYNVYRSTSFIVDVDSLIPIATIQNSEYTDIVTLEGTYYYIVEAVSILFTTLSQCESVEYSIPFVAPILDPILPNPANDSSIFLNWNDVPNAAVYFIYRSLSFIDNISGLTEIDIVIDSEYTDTLTATGTYYYVIVAFDGSKYSDISNCHYVYYEHPEESSFEFSVIGMIILIGIVTIIRRKNRV